MDQVRPLLRSGFATTRYEIGRPHPLAPHQVAAAAPTPYRSETRRADDAKGIDFRGPLQKPQRNPGCALVSGRKSPDFAMLNPGYGGFRMRCDRFHGASAKPSSRYGRC